jgi:uncharacterized protein YodC (DUF2158 family)
VAARVLPPAPPSMVVAGAAVREGDVVMLNSGGPPMLVELVTADTWQARCVWIADDTLARDSFDVRCLTVLRSEGQ